MNYRWFLFLVLLFFYGSLQAQEKIRVACVGNSVTEALSLPKGKDYPSIIQQFLGDSYEVKNFGVSGSTLLFEGHRPYVKSDKYQQSLDFRPHIVIISLGLNDTDPRNWSNYGDDFLANYNTLIDSYTNQETLQQVFVCINSPIFSGHKRFMSGTRDWYNAIQEQIKLISETRNISLIDLRMPLHDRIDLFNDYIHPNEEGTRIIANTVFNHLVAPVYGLSVDSIYGSGMVLQRHKEVILTGKGKAFSTVNLSFDKHKLDTQVDSLGIWRMRLPEQQAGGPYHFQIKSNADQVSMDSVYFGDVYFASGQSNMAFELRYDTAQVIRLQGKTWPKHIRYFKNQDVAQTSRVAWDSTILDKVNKLQFFEGKWTGLNTANITDYSAIAIAFLDDLSKQMEDVPLAIVEMAVGGSNTESWIDRKTLEQHPVTAPYIHNWISSDFIQDFCRTRATLNLKNSTVKNPRHPYQPAYNFEAGVSKWKNFKINGILWYQGESNAHNVKLHELLFPLLLDSWRTAWNDPSLPFYYVQLSGINRPSWPNFRNSQYVLASKLDNAYIVPSYDVGDLTNVHPINKYPVGRRLSQAVQATIYGKSENLLAPRLKSVAKQDAYIALEFDYVLDFQVLEQGALPVGFELLDQFGGVTRDLKIELKGTVVKIYVDKELSALLQLRYAYQPYTKANICNENLIPIPTFKIDL